MSITFFPTTGIHDDYPELNVSSANAYALFDLLGLGPDESGADLGFDGGELPAADFLGRVLLAQAMIAATNDEEGTPSFHDGNFIYSGRRPGYLAEKLAVLHTIATWAADRDATVAWG